MNHEEALEKIRSKFGSSVAAYMDKNGEYTTIGVSIGWETISKDDIREVEGVTGWMFTEIEGSYEGNVEIKFEK